MNCKEPRFVPIAFYPPDFIIEAQDELLELFDKLSITTAHYYDILHHPMVTVRYLQFCQEFLEAEKSD